MGRLPAQYAGKDIRWRSPYVAPANLTLAEGQNGVQFPNGLFANNTDKPFEIHRVKIVLTAISDGAVIADQPIDQMDRLVQIAIEDLSKSERITKQSGFVDQLILANTRTWEWEDPYTIVRDEDFIVAVTTAAAFPAEFDQIRIGVTFQGFRLVIAPPSESR